MDCYFCANYHLFKRKMPFIPLSYSYALIAFLMWALAVPSGIAAQSNTFTSGTWGLEGNYMAGRFLNHGAKYNPTALSHGFEIGYFKKTLGEKPWHKGMNFPEVGANLTFFRFGDKKVFGDALSIMATVKFFLVRSKVVNLYLKLGSGYGLITKRYNETENPNNSLISFPLNMAGMARVGLEWKLSNNVQLNTAVSFHHYSNSGAHLPNIGLNMPNITVGVKVFPKVRELSYNCEKPKDFKKNELIWKVSVGLQQLHKIEGGMPVPTRLFLVPGATVAYARYVNPGHKIYGGISFEHFRSVRHYIMHNGIATRHGVNFESTVPSIIIGDEYVFGWMSMFYSAGVYLWKNTATVTPLYFKVGVNFYVAQLGPRRGVKLFLGNNLKAHTNVAQYNDFNIGGTF